MNAVDMERQQIIAFLLASAVYWEKEADRCHRYQSAVDSATSKANVLRGAAADINCERHRL